MTSFFRWRFAALLNGFKDATAYQIEFLFEIFGSAAVPAAIQIMLWFAMFKTGGHDQIAGMTYHEMVLYTLVSVLFSQVRGGDHDFELQEMIRTGQLSNYLLRPVGVIEFVYLRGLAPRLFVAALCFLIGLIFSLFGWVDPLRMFLAMILALIGNIIHYQIGAALAATSFLWEEAFSILMVKNMIVQILSGELIPLTLFPANLEWVWKYTPFYLYVFGPTQYALGRWSDAVFYQNLLISLAWMFAGWLLIRLSWGLGIKNYSSLGG